jgi:hypothetical protein
MKRIIQGKIYNTYTATFIGNRQHHNQGDFHYEDTDLYRTPKGAFFVQGAGGAYSRWSRPCGSNGISGGSGIQAMTATEALEWCEDAGIDADVIAQYFSVEEA